MEIPQTALLLVIGALVVSIVAILASGRLGVRSGTARVGVAAPPVPVPAGVADLIERIGLVEADMKVLRRQWEDFETTSNRRFGAMARQGSRDRARAALETAPGEDEPAPDASQLPMFEVPSATPTPGHRPRLVAASRVGR